MPKRPKSHTLEDLSKREFRGLFPIEWVVRDKSSDYGIDQEIEIFSEQGQSTGIIFLVQLKATALSKNLTVRIPKDQLQYWQSHDVPVALFRFDEETRSFHFKWVDEISTSENGADAKSLAVDFGPKNKWASESARAIENRLRALRAIRSTTSDVNLPVTVFVNLADPTDSYPLRSTVEQLVTNLPRFILAPFPQDTSRRIEITINDNGVRVQFAGALECAFVTNERSSIDMGAVVSYVLCQLLAQIGLSSHATIVAAYISDHGLRAPDQERAFWASRSLIEVLPRALSLAVLNKLTGAQDYLSSFLLAHIFRSPYSGPDRESAISSYLLEGIKAAKETGRPTVIAAACYNLGRQLAVQTRYLGALKHYNQARKADPSYLTRAYFCDELGELFFFVRRYGCSAAAYAMPRSHEPSNDDIFRLADALLLSGRFGDAAPLFTKATKSGNYSIATEAAAKSNLCGWLIERTRATTVARQRGRANVKIAAAEKLPDEDKQRAYRDVLDHVDPLHSVCAYNVALDLAKNNQFMDAAHMFSINCFQNSWDTEGWTNLLGCLLNGQAPVDVFVTYLAVAIRLGGEEVYQAFRLSLPKAILKDGVLAIDATVMSIREQIAKEVSTRSLRVRYQLGSGKNIQWDVPL